MPAPSVIDTFKQLVPIANPSGQEATIRQLIQAHLKASGLPHTQHVDEAGNLLVNVPGDDNYPTWLFAAHMDSVPPCHGIVPCDDVKDNRPIIRSTGNTILGADDKSGIALLLALADKLVDTPDSLSTCHPIQWLFTTEEEVGLTGAKNLDMSLLKAQAGFVLDGEGSVGDIFHAGLTQYNLLFEITGKRAHAGIAPDQGVNAIAMGCALIAKLCIGRLSDITTLNIGTIEGGEALNVVAPNCRIRGELRSHDPAVLTQILADITAACQAVETQYPGGQIVFTPSHRYERFEVPLDHPAVTVSQAAASAAGIEPTITRMHIGSDAHILNAKGLPTVVLGMGFHYSHSLGEFIYTDELLQVLDWVWAITQY